MLGIMRAHAQKILFLTVRNKSYAHISAAHLLDNSRLSLSPARKRSQNYITRVFTHTHTHTHTQAQAHTCANRKTVLY